jgi:hypothetical protein
MGSHKATLKGLPEDILRLQSGILVAALPHRLTNCRIKPYCGTSELAHGQMPDFAIHLSATIIGEADSNLSRMP